MKRLDTPVLVVGGGPVGLSTALHLAAQDIDSIVIEKHPTTAHHPKASYFNARTMELLRDLGIADDVYATALLAAGVSFYTRLRGYKLGGFDAGDFPDFVDAVLAATTTPGCVSSQIVLEAVLKQYADADAHIQVLFGHEKVALEQDGDAVRTTVRAQHSDEELVITSNYVVACDGVRSATRQELGHAMLGPPAFGHLINMYIETDLESLVEEHDQALYWIAAPEAPGVFIGLGGDRQHWCFNTPYFPERGERPEDFDETRCRAKLHAAMGTDTLPIRLLAVGAWVLCGQVVDRYRSGRVFLGGDAAHSNIPTGGFGFNTGMQETHNLAWKLAAVLHGWAPAALLDTYHEERRPVALFNVEKSRANAVNIQETGAALGDPTRDNDDIDRDTARGQTQRAARTNAIARQKSHFLFLGQELGYGYWNSPIIVPDGSRHYVEEHNVADPVFTYIPNARPGARAPHCMVASATDPQTPHTILKLYNTHFVLLTCGAGDAWATSVHTDVRDIPLRSYHVGAAGTRCDLIDVENRWNTIYGIPDTGAVLIRPDGHVCWRAFGGPTTHDGLTLSDALAIAAGRRLAPAETREENTQ